MDLRQAIELCTFCPRLCSDRCPVSLAEARETVTPQAKMAWLGLLRQKTADAAAPPVLPSTLPVYACTGCGACTQACLHGVEPGVHLLAGRALAEAHQAGHPALADLPRRQRARARAAAAEVAAAVPEERRRPDAPVAYLPPCLGSPGPAEDARRMLRLSDRAPGLSGEAPMSIAAAESGCAGYPLLAGGFVEEFRLYAEVFSRRVADHATLIVGCPACAWLLRTQYPLYGVPVRPQVLHLAEWLGRHAEALPEPPRLGRIAYHDPCHLGRGLGVYEEPRAVLSRATAALCEFARSRKDAACAGGGALLPLTAPATARAIARERLRDLPPGVETVVTACPSCQRQLGGVAGAPRVLGLLEVFQE